MSITDLEAHVLAERLVEAREVLYALIGATHCPEPRRLAKVAARLGDATAEQRAWQRVLATEPDARDAWTALAQLYDERGDSQRARACRDRLGQAEPAPAPQPDDDLPFTDADLVRFHALFAGREDCHARMWRSEAGVGYSPIPAPLTPDLLRAHLDGSVTMGTYLVRVDDTVSFACLDLDISKDAIRGAAGDVARSRALRQHLHTAGLDVLARLTALGLAPLFEDSGFKGRHYWLFLPRPTFASEVRTWGQALLAHLGPMPPGLHLEFFPKQGQVKEGGKGNLVKLPLGLHLGSSRRSALLDAHGQAISDPFVALRAVRRLPLPDLAGEAPPVVGIPHALTAVGPSGAPLTPAPAPGDWTEADFEASNQVGPVYRGCAVLRGTIEAALADRRIHRDAAVVLAHSLGHLPDGVKAVNYVYDRVPDFPQDQRMGAPHRGSVISCARVKQRLPEMARRVGCDCKLEGAPGEYPHPLLHRGRERIVTNTGPKGLDEALDALNRAEDRMRNLQAEVVRLRADAIERLGAVPGKRWGLAAGDWVLTEDDGLPVLRFEAR